MKRPSPKREQSQWRLTPFKIALIYANLGALWILLSDELLAMLVSDPAMLTRLQTFKGWFYILVTACLLYGLVHHSTAEIRRSAEELRESTRDLKALQEETQEERNRLQVLIDTAPVGFVLHSVRGDHGLMLFNKAAESIIGRPLLPALDIASEPTHYGIHRPTGEPFPPEELPVSRALRGESCAGVEMLIQQPSGRQAYILANSAPVRDAKGRIVGAVVAFQDITSIREQQRLQDEFLTTAAHELKTPVTTIKGYVQMMQKWAPGGHEPREGQALEVINAQCDRIDRRVREMLEAVRSRVAPTELHRVSFDVGELTSQVRAAGAGHYAAPPADLRAAGANPGGGRSRAHRGGAGEPVGQRLEVLAGQR